MENKNLTGQEKPRDTYSSWVESSEYQEYIGRLRQPLSPEELAGKKPGIIDDDGNYIELGIISTIKDEKGFPRERLFPACLKQGVITRNTSYTHKGWDEKNADRNPFDPFILGFQRLPGSFQYTSVNIKMEDNPYKSYEVLDGTTHFLKPAINEEIRQREVFSEKDMFLIIEKIKKIMGDGELNIRISRQIGFSYISDKEKEAKAYKELSEVISELYSSAGIKMDDGTHFASLFCAFISEHPEFGIEVIEDPEFGIRLVKVDPETKSFIPIDVKPEEIYSPLEIESIFDFDKINAFMKKYFPNLRKKEFTKTDMAFWLYGPCYKRLLGFTD